MKQRRVLSHWMEIQILNVRWMELQQYCPSVTTDSGQESTVDHTFVCQWITRITNINLTQLNNKSGWVKAIFIEAPEKFGCRIQSNFAFFEDRDGNKDGSDLSAPNDSQSNPRTLPNHPIPSNSSPKTQFEYGDFSVIDRFGGDVSGHACSLGPFLNDPRVGLPMGGL